jgi:hypothetical protein
MSDMNPENWRSVSDLPANSYVDDITEHMRKVMNDIALAESRDIRAALAAWHDIDAEHLMRIKYHADGPQVRVNQDANLFTRSAPKLILEMPRLIVVADIRQVGHANPQGHVLPLDWRRHERTFDGERYTIALLHRDETGKIPPIVRTNTTDIIDFATGMDD